MSKSIIQPDEEVCFETGSRFNLEKHHCIHGRANRTIAEKYGLWVYLRSDIHRKLHDKDKELDRKYEKLAQAAFERKYSHELWMQLVKKNYL